MSTTKKHETDVLIVGAGPTGLTLACELLRRGVGCRVIDKASAPATTSRALGLQPRTLELFDTMGVVDRVLSTGGPVIDANLYDGDRLLLALSTAGVQELDTPYPRLWITPQTSVERPLEARLGELGGAVERAREFVGLREEDSQVVATVKRGDDGADETEEIRASWLVGCDGAHSRVRKTLSIAFEGSTYEERFLLADLDLDWSRERNRTHTWFPPEGMFTVFPLPGSSQWRIFAAVEGEIAPPVSLELFRRLFRERTGDATTTLSNPTWLSNFTINRRMVDRYRVGRVFLAGDAAHIHSPFGAQGMNTGIQDAYNLAWKLALVSKGKASGRLLDTYEEERLPVAERVLAQTDANTRVLLSDNPVVRFLREHVLTLDAVQDYLARRSSQLLVNYRASSLSRSYQEPMMKALLGHRGGEKAGVADRFDFRAAPHAGDRAPDGMAVDVASREETSLFREFRGTHFNLLLFDGLEHTEAGYANLSKIARQVEALLGNTVNPHIVLSTDEVPEQLEWNGSVLLDGAGALHELYGAGAESLYLIRPDGYVGLRGQPAAAEPLLEYLDRMEEGLGVGVSSSRDATRAIEPDPGHGKEVTAMKQKMTGERVAYVAPGRGGSVWIGDRELVTFKQTGEETGGLFALVEVVGLPGSGPPPHIHHRVDEVYCLLEGELEILDGDRTFTAEAGSVFRIPKGTLHAWKNRTDEPARTLLFVCPAGFEGFFEEAGVQAADPSSPPPPPTQEDLRRMLELGRKYETEYPTLPDQ